MVDIFQNYYYRRERKNGKSKYYCLFCEKVYKCRASVRTHYNRHHKKKTIRAINNVDTTQNTGKNITDYPLNPSKTSEPFPKYYPYKPIVPPVEDKLIEKTVEIPPVNKPKEEEYISIIEIPRFSDYDFLLKVIQQKIRYRERDEKINYERWLEQQRIIQEKEEARLSYEWERDIDWLHETLEKFRAEERREYNRISVMVLRSMYMKKYPKEKDENNKDGNQT
jgi:hypothetical protein